MPSATNNAITIESLIDEYGLDSETAERLSKELPNFLKPDDDEQADPYKGLPCCGDNHYDWLMQDAAEDQRLTAEQRKALPDEVFCGPDRSFPVNDCAHYTAALRMLGRYGGPGNKEEIKDCIVKKGKELGCPGTEEKDETQTPESEKKEEPEMSEEKKTEEIEEMPEPPKEDPAPPEEPPKENPEPEAEAPVDQEEEKEDPTAIHMERMKAAMMKAGVPQETMRKIIEEMHDEADAKPIGIEKSLYDKLKRKLKAAGVKAEMIPLVMEPISVDETDSFPTVVKKVKALSKKAGMGKEEEEKLMEELNMLDPMKKRKLQVYGKNPRLENIDETDSFSTVIKTVKGLSKKAGMGKEEEEKLLEELNLLNPKHRPPRRDPLESGGWMKSKMDVMEPISVDKEFIKKLKQIMKAAKLPKEMQVLVMEPISVDSLDSCDVVMDSLNFTIGEDALSFGDGLLKGSAVCAAAMVQDYGGTKILKCPDELKLAVEYARMLPITDGHPESALVRDQKEIKGWTGLLSWNPDKRTIECDFEITDAPLIEKVKSGKRDLSIGFTCEIEQKEGVFTTDDKEEKFDGIQRNIVLNHLAAGIDKGRCPSPLCGIKSDAPPPGPTLPGGPTPAPETGKGDPPGSIPRELALRAMKFHGLTQEEWDKLTEAERLRLVEQITTRTAAPYPMGKKDEEAEKVVKEARELVETERTKLIDSIMDTNPPKPRRYFEDMNLVVLKDIKALLDSKKEGERLPFSDSSKPGEGAINDAYSKIHRKSP